MVVYNRCIIMAFNLTKRQGVQGLKDRTGEKRLKKIGTLALIAAAIFWGGEFVVEKDVLFHIEPNWSNTIRFFTTSVFALFVWRQKFRNATKTDWKKGLVSGGLMGLGFAFQTMGLETINAGVNAFLSAAYVLVIPFLLWGIEKKRPRALVLVSAAFALTGVVFMSSSGFSFQDFYMGKGEILTLLGSVCYASGIVAVDYYAPEMDEKLLAGMQFIATFFISLIFALCFESVPKSVDAGLVIEFAYLIVFATLFAQLLFTYGMKYVSSGKAGVIFLLESVSALVLGMLFLHEKVYWIQVLGSLMIIFAIVLQNKSDQAEENETT